MPGSQSGANRRMMSSSKRDVEARAAGVALAAGAAAELVVDAARLVALGADDVQAAGLDDAVVLVLPLVRGRGRRACRRG